MQNFHEVCVLLQTAEDKRVLTCISQTFYPQEGLLYCWLIFLSVFLKNKQENRTVDILIFLQFLFRFFGSYKHFHNEGYFWVFRGMILVVISNPVCSVASWLKDHLFLKAFNSSDKEICFTYHRLFWFCCLSYPHCRWTTSLLAPHSL